ncbi:uncharacterized protein L201_000358 [Kwoniella dendrophila CBS 6074]|uniref:Myb-like domain-containing protein n=1 Tax=Kwoniella dendrophila CBS 6074 TaxID=1295534 RepID=A0AAX4JL63_9TREE
MVVKRERNSSPISESENSTLTPYDSISVLEDEKPDIKRVKGEKAQGRGNQKAKKEAGGNKTTKTPWSAEEDTALIEIMDQIIKSQLWPAIKSSGNQQLISRGSYGSQYHAKLLLKQGKTASKK